MATSDYAVNPDSHNWKEVARFFEDEIKKAQHMLEQPGIDQPKTEFLRGKIRQARDALKLGQRHSDHSEV